MSFVFFGDPNSIDWGEWEKNRVKTRAALDARWVGLRDYLPAIARLHATGRQDIPIDGALIREILGLAAAELSYSHTLATEATLRSVVGKSPPPAEDAEIAAGPTVAERIGALEADLANARQALAMHEFVRTMVGTRVCGSCGIIEGSGQPHTATCSWILAMGRK